MFLYNLCCASKSRQVGGDEKAIEILEYRLLAAGLGKSRQVGGDEKAIEILEYKLLAAGLGKCRQL